MCIQKYNRFRVERSRMWVKGLHDLCMTRVIVWRVKSTLKCWAVQCAANFPLYKCRQLPYVAYRGAQSQHPGQLKRTAYKPL